VKSAATGTFSTLLLTESPGEGRRLAVARRHNYCMMGGNQMVIEKAILPALRILKCLLSSDK